jgi:two-component system, OmpR family, sensor histidine kinase ChvG
MSRAQAILRTASRIRTSRIGLRVLAFNILVLFLPVAGILYLDVYEDRLLDTQERGMIEQARLVAAALGERPAIAREDATALVARLGYEGDARIRVYDSGGVLLADSRRVLRPSGTESAGYGQGGSEPSGRRPMLYRLGAWLVRAKDAGARAVNGLLGRHPRAEAETASSSDPPLELRAALAGQYGAATRPTPAQRSLTLNCALPIKSGSAVIGAVIVSQSTYRMLQALYTLRLRIFEVVLASMVLAALLSVLMSATIVRPLIRLRGAATSLAERRTPLSGTFTLEARRDEIGDLARALDELAARLDAHIKLLESFAADVSHEFRNPLASIRTAAEMLVDAPDREDRARFVAMLTRDVDRLERLVAGVRELARIDAQLAHEPATRVDVGALLTDLVNGRQIVTGRPPEVLHCHGRTVVRASPDRLIQVFDNIMENARSFGAEGPVVVTVRADGRDCQVSIADRGPGIPPAHLERIFERFFTYRPDPSAGRRDHAGLGLAIARTIVEGYGGTITAKNRSERGACFEVRLPLADARMTE